MTISSEVTYGAGRPQLYRELSAAEDRAMTDTGSNAMPESLPSFETESSAPVFDDVYAAVVAFDSEMFGFDEVMRRNKKAGLYLLEMQGTPWPTPYSAPNYTDPTVEFYRSNINQGWNAAAQPGAPPGDLRGFGQPCGCGRGLGPCRPGCPCAMGLSGCGPRYLGGFGAASCGCPFSGTDDDLDFDLHTTESWGGGRRLSGLGALGVMEAPESKAQRMAGMQRVLAAAALPTTKGNREVTRKLLDQSVKLADQMADYAGVAERAAKFANVALKRAGVADERTKELALRIFDPETHEVREDASAADVARLRRLRQEAFEAAREAVRSEKVKLVAKGQAENTFAQAAILQKLAAATLGGQPDAAAVYAKMFDKIGQEGVALRGLRERQKANWLSKEVRELNGLEDLDAIDNRVMGADYWEAELDGIEIVEDAYLGEIEGWLRRKIKKAAKKVKKKVKKAAKKVGRGVKTAAKATGRVARTAASAAKNAAKVAAQRAARAAVKAASAAAKRAAAAAGGAAKAIANSRVAKNFVKVARPVAKAIRSAAKVSLEPVKMTLKAGKRVAKGDFRGALRSVKSAAKNTVKGLTDVVRHGVFGVACGLENTRLVRAAGQAVGQAVGTIYGGGTAGGAVGREAGRKGNDINRGMCKGMKQLGLTGDQKLNLSARNLKKSLNATAKDLKRTTFSKEAMLASAMRIAAGAALGGAGASIPGADKLSEFGSKQFANLGVKALKDQGQKFLKKKGAQIVGRAVSSGAGRILPGKAGRIVGRVAGGAARAYVGGGQQALVKQLKSQVPSTKLLRNPQALVRQVASARQQVLRNPQALVRQVASARQQVPAVLRRSMTQQQAFALARQQAQVTQNAPAAAQLLAQAMGV